MSTTIDDSSTRLRVAVTGASGLIGSALVRRLEGEGHTVLRLVRHEPRGSGEIRWDPAAGSIDAAGLEGADAVVNLAGENIGQRWTEARRRRIRESRAGATRLLATTLVGLARKPRVLVNASAVGIYGERGDEVLTEASAPGGGFLADVVRVWAAATQPAADAGIRVVLTRFGVVLSARGGALAKMLTPFKLGVGGPLGSGKQWMPWIALEDVAAVIDRAIHDRRLSGPVNAVTGTVTNRELSRALGRVLHRPALFPVPAFALKLMLGEMAEETALVSQRVEPTVLRRLGHTFLHPELEGALRVAVRE